MPGSIKIDDGSGNYTILTNAGSLGSDKTITIPNETATLATTNGITEYDAWYFTANITSAADITSNWARNNSEGFSKIGTGMSESSGIFTFPSTGIWRIDVQILSECRDQAFPNVMTKVTLDNSSYTTAMQVYFGDRSGLGTAKKHSGFTVVDVTDTSNVKVKFTTVSLNSTNFIFGNTNTRFAFTRLGDT
jgi:hypothetical protein